MVSVKLRRYKHIDIAEYVFAFGELTFCYETVQLILVKMQQI